MKEKKYLKLYERWGKSGKLPKFGLCCSLPEEVDIGLFYPTLNDFSSLEEEGLSTVFWGCGLNEWGCFDSMALKFTPLRQNIVLFLAAMNGELDK